MGGYYGTPTIFSCDTGSTESTEGSGYNHHHRLFMSNPVAGDALPPCGYRCVRQRNTMLARVIAYVVYIPPLSSTLLPLLMANGEKMGGIVLTSALPVFPKFRDLVFCCWPSSSLTVGKGASEEGCGRLLPSTEAEPLPVLWGGQMYLGFGP